MSRNVELRIDHGVSIELNFTCQTPHRMYYKVWTRPGPKSPWKLDGDGFIHDSTPDHRAIGVLPAGGQIAYYLGAWGRRRSKWRAYVTFSQAGKLVKDGLLEEPGTTDKDGFDATETEVSLP